MAKATHQVVQILTHSIHVRILVQILVVLVLINVQQCT